MALVAESNTSTEAELLHTVSEDWRQPFVAPAEPTAEEIAAAADAAANGAESDETTEGKTSVKEKVDAEPRKSRMARLHDRLDAQDQTISELRQELLKRGENGNGQPTGNHPKPKAAEADTKPAPDNPKYKTYEDYIEDLTDWKLRQTAVRTAAETTAAAERTEAEKVLRAYNAQVEAVRTAHPDFDEVMSGEDVPIPPHVQVSLLNCPNGAEVAYHLLKHPEVNKKLCEMSPAAGAVEIGRLSHMLKPTQQAAAPAQRKQSSAPPPIGTPPAAVSGRQDAKRLDEVDMREYRRRRAAGESS